jgi:hypothetical protein
MDLTQQVRFLYLDGSSTCNLPDVKVSSYLTYGVSHEQVKNAKATAAFSSLKRVFCYFTRA